MDVKDSNLRLDLNRRSMKLTRNGHKTMKATAATFELVKRRRHREPRRSDYNAYELDVFINCSSQCDTVNSISDTALFPGNKSLTMFKVDTAIPTTILLSALVQPLYWVPRDNSHWCCDSPFQPPSNNWFLGPTWVSPPNGI